MQIFLNEERKMPLPSGAVVTYPAGWSGTVPGAYAAKWIEEGAAEALDLDAPVPALTPRQAQLLGHLADQIDAEANASGAAAGETGSDAGAGDIKLADLTLAELKDVAAKVGLALPAGRVTKAKLVGLLTDFKPEAGAGNGEASSEGQA